MPSLEPSLSPGNFTNLTLVQCTFTHWGCLSDKLKGGHASKSNIPSHHWYSNNWNPFTCTKKEKQHFPSKDSQAYSLLEERIFEEWLEFTKTTIGLCCWQIFNQIQLHLNDVWSDKIQGWPCLHLQSKVTPWKACLVPCKGFFHNSNRKNEFLLFNSESPWSNNIKT